MTALHRFERVARDENDRVQQRRYIRRTTARGVFLDVVGCLVLAAGVCALGWWLTR
jgi:hypothetical protein